MSAVPEHEPALTPGLDVPDPRLRARLQEAMLRLRREVAWCWHQRAGQPDPGGGVLPPVTDPATENLDLVRYEAQKARFFQHDATAGYLTEEIRRVREQAAPDGERSPGSWSWLSRRLELDDASQFVLALGLAARVDAGLGPVFATCMNDLSRPYPTLALAQRLWDDPGAVIGCADIHHDLYRFGLLSYRAHDTADAWWRPLDTPSLVAEVLLAPDRTPATLRPLDDRLAPLGTLEDGDLAVKRVQGQRTGRMRVVPLVGARDSDFEAWTAHLAWEVGRPAVALGAHRLQRAEDLQALVTGCWLKGWDIAVSRRWSSVLSEKDLASTLAAFERVPLRWYLPVADERTLEALPPDSAVSPVRLQPLSYQQRIAAFERVLDDRARFPRRDLERAARRFRFEASAIRRVAAGLGAGARDGRELERACAADVLDNMAHLAQAVKPRFQVDELVLPPDRKRQYLDLVHAMSNLATVHYRWGTGAVWNEAGLSALFCGAPGTGKTMAAEVLGSELGLPVFCIDLSQVVNKYIGETEKNLKRVFDGAEQAECVLFFDECDALFGKRTDVKDSHDRFANIEISYLLERMERFKGLAILATNRRKDLDEAFMRRLRYVIEFPVPDVDERMQIWRGVFPANVDVSGLDFVYLARQFSLTGGHIRSIAFNACLYAAGADNEPGVGMRHLLRAVKRELEKLQRSAGVEQFGKYAELLEGDIAA